MKRKNNAVKLNGNLPSFVFDFQDGEYICEIEGFSISDRNTDKLVVKISTIEDTVYGMAFKMYYDLSGESLCKNSPLGRLLKELGLIRKNKIKWEELSGQQVLAEVSTSVYEISNITAEKPLKIRCFQLFIIFDNVVPLYYLYF